jgi:hypothetical protein
MTAEKVREDRLRRMAKRQGYVLRKTRRRDHRALDYGTFSLLDDRNRIKRGFNQVSLDQIELFLTSD